MRAVAYLATVALLLLSPAWAYERPDAISLAGVWDLCLVQPMLSSVSGREAKPDSMPDSPTWGEVIDPNALPPWDGEWQPVTVPAAWEQVAGADYNGAGWYARFLDIPPEWCGEGRRIWLEFDAVATAAGVWANDQFIGAHVGDSSPWRVELTDVVAQALEAPRVFAEEIPGAVEGPSVINPYTLLIAVYVDELPGSAAKVFGNTIAPDHGGIWQDVRMYSTGPVAIKPGGVHISADPASGDVEVTVELDSKIPVDAEHFSLLLAFRAPDSAEDRIDLAVGGVHREHSTVDAEAGVITVRHQVDSPVMWSHGPPQLYEVLVTARYAKPRSSQSEPYGSMQSDFVWQTFAFRAVHNDGN
jgi:beta-galactosidase/beta-glucuronidase